jgi:hypothetical protein
MVLISDIGATDQRLPALSGKLRHESVFPLLRLFESSLVEMSKLKA